MRYILMSRDEENNKQIYFDENKKKFIETPVVGVSGNLVPISIATGLGMSLYGLVKVNTVTIAKIFYYLGGLGKISIVIIIGIVYLLYERKRREKLLDRAKYIIIDVVVKKDITKSNISVLYRENIQGLLIKGFLAAVTLFLLSLQIMDGSIIFILFFLSILLSLFFLFVFVRDTPLSKRKAIGIYEQYLNKQ